MKNLLFNSHDIVLALVVVLCFVQAIRAVCGSAFAGIARKLLAFFFILNALVALDTLLFWGDGIKHAAFNFSPWLPLCFSFAAFAIGPALYWLCRALLFPNHSIRWTDYLQLLPALATPIYLYWACYRHPLEQQRDLILELAIFSNTETNFLAFLTFKKLIPVIYGLLCIAIIFRHASTPSQMQSKSVRMLNLYAGFAFIWMWVFLTHVLGQWLPVAASDMMGIFGNYMNLTLVTAISFTSVESSSPATGVIHESVVVEEDSENEDLVTLSEQIHKLILAEKPYLNPRLTLERFAALLETSPRQVSCAINRCFQQNFHEYINRFRVEEAKRLLRDPAHRQYTILEIAQQAGFNSKATFHRFFKLLVGVTPSAFRQPPANELTPQESHCG
jgi:AraC-like DNA-binding protein